MSHGRSGFALLALILLACLIAGCKKRTETPEGVTLKPVPEERSETGWPLYEVRNEGFALALPPEWRQFDMNPATFEKTFGEVMAKNPQLKELYPNLVQQIRMGIKFFGVEEAAIGTGFATNVNVLVVPIPPQVTPEQVVDAGVSQLEQIPDVQKPITRERVKTQAGDSERLRYRMSMQLPNRRVQLAITQYSFVANGKAYTVSLTTLTDREAHCAPTFDKIGQRFRFLN